MNQHLFTCISCTIAFTSAEEQRRHYHSDLHRYNMKRRVASLPPVSESTFAEKSQEIRIGGPAKEAGENRLCIVCNKKYTTANAFTSHINSKRHKINESKRPATAREELHKPSYPLSVQATIDPFDTVNTNAGDSSELPLDTLAQIDLKIAAAPEYHPSESCLFCATRASSLQHNLEHMALVHSFFIPDEEYLVNANGLITYLNEKIAVGNVCIYCNHKSREFRSADAVRKHMLDKSHCKIAYENEEDRLELSDYYDFTTSYPNDNDEGDWEDVEDDDQSSVISGRTDPDGAEQFPHERIRYGDSPLELVLPSGARVGHRTLKQYYSQSFPRRQPNQVLDSPQVRRSADKSSLVPMRGGFGEYGVGALTVKARNAGEAREAGRHIREFRDQRRREDFKTKVALVHNHQKHYRDPLLQ